MKVQTNTTEYAIIARAAGGWSLLSRRSTPRRLAATRDPAEAMAWGERQGGLAGLLAWIDAQPPDTRDTLRDRAVAAVDLATGVETPLHIPAPDFDGAWSPTLHPIDPAMCRGKQKVYAAPKAPRAARAAVGEPQLV